MCACSNITCVLEWMLQQGDLMLDMGVGKLALSFFIWGHSSVGRASALQAEGHRFESVCLHHYSPLGDCFFSFSLDDSQ